MADDGVKISGLPEILTEPASGEMAAVVSGGVTYKRNIGNRLPSTAQKSALAGYGGIPSGSNPYATQAAVKPISDLSRVFRLTGDGIPIFPDNVAGTIYKSNFATTDGWVLAGGTTGSVSASNGRLVFVKGAAGELCQKTVSIATGKLIRVRVRVASGTPQTAQLAMRTDGVNVTTKSISVDGKWNIVDYLTTGAVTTQIMYCPNAGSTELYTLEFDAIYIGSGLYDTPVYDKACCNRFTNNGVLPVPGQRGLAMSFNGNAYLQADNPVIGTTGTIACTFVASQVANAQAIWSNYAGTSTYSGFALRQEASGALQLLWGTGTSTSTLSLGTIIANTKYSVEVILSTGLITVYVNGAQYTQSSPTIGSGLFGNLNIGGYYHIATLRFTGTIYDIGYDARIWTADDAIRYHNGDDAVDSQQKAITGVPHAIAVNDAYGFLGSNGLRFPAAQVPSADANTLDDYEEGVFTPSITFGGGSTGMTYGVRQGTYTKIGNRVIISIVIGLTAKGSSTGTAIISGLPFAVADTSFGGLSAISLRASSLSFADFIQGRSVNLTTTIALEEITNAGAQSALTDVDFANNTALTVSVVYPV